MSALPNCEECGAPITFYMHQRCDVLDKRMRYWHPACCPDCPMPAPPPPHVVTIHGDPT